MHLLDSDASCNGSTHLYLVRIFEQTPVPTVGFTTTVTQCKLLFRAMLPCVAYSVLCKVQLCILQQDSCQLSLCKLRLQLRDQER
jgi:hypothetical protein